jgi:two-component system chemotaxis response regulator CheB
VASTGLNYAAPEERAVGAPIRLLIVDDSMVARTVFARMLEPRREFAIVGSVADAAQALEVVRQQKVDVVLLDLEMPGMNGLELLPQLLLESDGARVLVVSSSAAEGATATVQALALGAADTLQKPGGANFVGRFADTLADRLIRIAATKWMRPTMPVAENPTKPAAIIREPIECLAIGASTGGLHALTELLRNLPETFTAPILITQHLPADFMPYFADQMQTIARRPTAVAREGDRLVPGTILVAPGEGHIRMVRMGGDVRIRLDHAVAATRCMPSVDPMFESLAAIFGVRGLAVVLSGMGRDGTIGARSVADVGGEILVQDPETCVVWGMPGSVSEAGLASAILTPAKIAKRIMVRAGGHKWN